MSQAARPAERELEARQQLDRLRVLYESILWSAGEGIYGVDQDGRATFVNAAASQMLGFGPEELLEQKTHHLIHHSHADGSPYPIEACAMTEALIDGQMTRVSDEVFWRKDGSSFPVEYTATPIVMGGKPDGAVVVFSDISHRAREEELRTQAAVQEGLRQQNAELNALAARLEESNDELEQFAHIVSHDLQAPLRAIASHIELVEEALGDGLDSESREDMSFVADGARRMQRMIEGMLAFSSATSGERSVEAIDLDLVLDGGLRMLGADIEGAGGRIRRDGQLPTVVGDEDQIERVLLNLVGNALRYGPPGETVVSISAERTSSAWCVSVADNGPGVPETHRERIFDMFQRLHPGDADGGVGMGLALCRRIVSRHGGTIWVEDAAGGGANFRFTLPADVHRASPGELS